MHRNMQIPRHREHLLQSLQHTAALLAHMNRHGYVLPRQRFQCPQQLPGGVKALRRISEAQGDAQSPVR